MNEGSINLSPSFRRQCELDIEILKAQGYDPVPLPPPPLEGMDTKGNVIRVISKLDAWGWKKSIWRAQHNLRRLLPIPLGVIIKTNPRILF